MKRITRVVLSVIAIAALAIAVFAASPGTARASSGNRVNPFNVSGQGVHVTGTLTFTGASNFTLTNVTLCDTANDGFNAHFQAVDQYSQYAVHTNSNGPGSCISYGTLSGSASYTITYVHIKIWSNSSTGGLTSPNYYNPYR